MSRETGAVQPGLLHRASSAQGGHLLKLQLVRRTPGRSNGKAVAIVVDQTLGVDVTKYLHRDHLGSIATITDSAGSVLERLSYDSHGKRRSATTWQAASVTAAEIRGYTGHEHLDDVGLIHMNGRVYDPGLGRMLSPDPVTQAPENAQNYNRYAYVMNNPMRFTDPNGYNCFEVSLLCGMPTFSVPAFVGFNTNTVPANWPYGFIGSLATGTWIPFQYGDNDPFGFSTYTEEDWQRLVAEANQADTTDGKPDQGEVVGLKVSDIQALAEVANSLMGELRTLEPEEVFQGLGLPGKPNALEARTAVAAIAETLYPIQLASVTYNAYELASTVASIPLQASIGAALGVLGISGQVASAVLDVAGMLSMIKDTQGMLVGDSEDGYSIACNAQADCIAITPGGVVNVSDIRFDEVEGVGR